VSKLAETLEETLQCNIGLADKICELQQRVGELEEKLTYARMVYDQISQDQEDELNKLKHFLFIMVKEEATTLSKAKELLKLKDMNEARAWYSKQESLPATEAKEEVCECDLGKRLPDCKCGFCGKKIKDGE